MESTQANDKSELVESADKKAVKRAQWEAFEFELEAPGLVRVTNGSYDDKDDHSYRVNVENGVPVVCECPAFEYNDGPCKHLVGIAIREPVLEAAQTKQQDTQSVAIADGGQDIETCPNGQEGCCGPEGDGLPCFNCWMERD